MVPWCHDHWKPYCHSLRHFGKEEESGDVSKASLKHSCLWCKERQKRAAHVYCFHPHHAFDIIRKSLPFLNIIFFKRLNNAAWCSTRWPFDSEKLLDIVASHAAGLKPYSGMACGLEEPSQGVKTVTGKFPEVLFVYEGGTNMVRYPDPVDVFWCICIISTPEQFGEH